MIILQTDQCVRDGPSLLLSRPLWIVFLTCSLLVGPLVGGYLCPGCGLVSFSSLVAFARAVGGFLGCLSSARVMGLFYLVGFPFGLCWFCFGLMPLFLYL